MTKQAFNPYLPSWEYIPDGEPYVFGDRVYVYGSHDFFNGYVFCMGDYMCWSAPVDDLGNWRCEGVCYPKTADPMNEDGHMCLYAPDVAVGPDGKYYLYYVLDKVCVVSVAVSDVPQGPFQFLGYVHYPDGTRLGEREGDEPQFDPGVICEDGKVHLYTGFAGNHDKSRHGAMYTVLDGDMLTVLKAPEIIVPGDAYSQGTQYEGHAFFEAPSIRKRNNIYYFIYSSEVMHELCYATSDNPAGPFTYGGVIVSNCDLGIDSDKPADMIAAFGANNHGSMEKIGNDWYIFYHRHTHGTWYSRQGCAEKLAFRADGSIIQAQMTSCGLNGGPLLENQEYPAYIACRIFTNDMQKYVGGDRFPRVTQDGRDGDELPGYITGIRETTTIGFKYFDFEKTSKITIATRAYCNGTFHVRTAWDGEDLAVIKVHSSNIWQEYTADFRPGKGVKPLYLVYDGPGVAQLRSVRFENS